MSRLIDADVLKQHYAWWGECGEKGEENKRLFDEIIDHQPTVGGWMSVEERLPEKEGTYLTFTNRNQIHMDSFCIYSIADKFWGGGNGIVTHWQPLPAPPEAE